jgi:hypothetical protein
MRFNIFLTALLLAPLAGLHAADEPLQPPATFPFTHPYCETR